MGRRYERRPIDLGLARRLERTEAVANVRYVEARARLAPGSGAERQGFRIAYTRIKFGLKGV